MHEDSSLIPDEFRTGRPTLAWVRWFNAFMEPFTSILRGLGMSSIYDNTNYANMGLEYQAHLGLAPSNLSSCDIIVVQRLKSS